MKKGPYPRIAQALGVEVGERFVYKDPNKEEVTLYVEENGMVVFIFKDGQKLQDIGMDYVLVQAINHPDRIIRKPSWTEEEIVIAELILSLYERKDIVFGRYENGQLWWKVGNRAKNDFPNKFFPSIRPRNEFNLIEIIGGTE
jgi:hypothetical protein